MKNNRGIALISVLILTVLGMIITAGVSYLVVSGYRIFSVQKRYSTALDAAKGAYEVIVGKIDQIKCADSPEDAASGNCGTCPNYDQQNQQNQQIVCMEDYSCIGGSSNSCYEITSRLLFKSPPLYAFEIESQKAGNPNEKAIVQFVYRVKK